AETVGIRGDEDVGRIFPEAGNEDVNGNILNGGAKSGN
ncbi:hypothetical protein A2U01_0084846, partial [Trifolium medium]|nr:hypothetical protein [Trifolium medium]